MVITERRCLTLCFQVRNKQDLTWGQKEGLKSKPLRLLQLCTCTGCKITLKGCCLVVGRSLTFKEKQIKKIVGDSVENQTKSNISHGEWQSYLLLKHLQGKMLPEKKKKSISPIKLGENKSILQSPLARTSSALGSQVSLAVSVISVDL